MKGHINKQLKKNIQYMQSFKHYIKPKGKLEVKPHSRDTLAEYVMQQYLI